jgi:hypothetical protein
MYRPGAKPHQPSNLQDAGALAQFALRLAFKLDSDRRPTYHFRFSPKSGGIADIAACLKGAQKRSFEASCMRIG